MKFNFRVASAAIVLAGLCSSAQSAVIADLGTNPTAATSYTVNHAAGSFNDVFKFNLSTLSDTIASSVGLTLAPFYQTTFTSFGLFADAFGTGTGGSLITSGVISATPSSATLTQNNVASGNYYFELNGESTGVVGSVYLFSANTSASPNIPPPIPEPETYALMLVGLGVLGAVAKRRSAKLARQQAGNLAIAA
jgi:hypothetical protein